MIPFTFLRKILLTLAPLALFYLLRKKGKVDKQKKKFSSPDFDKSKIVEGEIVNEKK